MYRAAAEATVGRRIVHVHAPDPWYLKRGLDATGASAALVGRRVEQVRRIGKLLLVDTDGPTLGLRFGMTGRLVVEGVAAIEHLEYSSNRLEPRWVRFALGFDGGGDMQVVDPRRLGGVELEPATGLLGVDLLAVRPAQLRDLLAGSAAPVKAWLLDQRHVAGIGNLIADEALWRAGIDPARPARSLDERDVRRLHRSLQATVRDLTERGGSHTGDLHRSRVRGGLCPKDGAPLDRRTIGGRTTFSCPQHQR